MHCPQSYTLRQDLSHTRDKCPISNTGLCLRRNAVYQLTCYSCDQQWIGTREIILSWLLTRHASSMHDRVNEDLNNENSSVKKTYLLLLEQRLWMHWSQDYYERNDPANLPPSCKRDQIKMRDYMDKRVTPPKLVTSPTSGPPRPCKQALRDHS